jgi:hypothetical protein
VASGFLKPVKRLKGVGQFFLRRRQGV